ncbi:MAG: protein phosphatase 2C domain-containing protein [Deltaproteobacteria bacterium]|jgi:protein phosphatase|nr:protein phosphatase 2C domain-containing protein [Deltaproteobacteria bacterium]
MRAVFFTSTGEVRVRNEDALLCQELVSGRDMRDAQLLELQGRSVVLAVADGVGGEPGGAEAAAAVLTALEVLRFMPFGPDAQDRLEEAIRRGVSQMGAVSRKKPELAGMATTLAGLWTDGDRGLVFNCGDCRVYRFRQSFLEPLSKDHSLVYELYMSGEIKAEDMAVHPMRHILTSSIRDGGEAPRVFLREISILRGDSYFICSDGVWEAVPQKDLEDILSAAPPLQAGQLLAERLLGIGARDNATFLWLY